MAKNKHALIRYRALDKCFSNHRVKYSFADLMREVTKALEAYDPATSGISRSMLYEDIAFMESTNGWGADIERIRDGRYTYLRYTDPHFSIQKMPLNELEFAQLREATRVLQHFKGLPQFEWLEEVSAKLSAGTDPGPETPIIAFDSNQYLKGIQHLGDLYAAVRYKRPLCVTYQHFGAPEPYRFVFHPYFLKQFNNRWFVFGHCAENELKMLNLALDRIHTIEACAKPYIENVFTDFGDYFEDIIGVTRPTDGPVEEIHLWVAPQRAGYILTKPLHGSQRKICHDADGLVISLSLIVNPEFLQLLFSFGASLKVLSPQSLQEQLLAEATAVRQQYAPGPDA